MTNNAEGIGTLLERAYSYAGLGLEVFPVAPTKRPLVSQLEATTDLDQIEAWWRRWPEALIGHRISAFHLLLDIDPRHGGHETWTALRAELPEFRTRTHMSGRGDGGGHVWFQRPADQVTSTKLDAWARSRGLGHEITVKGKGVRWTAGIDLLQHDHRYTILPPSRHPDTGEPYRWAKGRGLAIDPAPMPALLAELISADEMAPVEDDQAPRFRDPDSIADWYSNVHGFGPLLAAAGWTVVAGDGDADGSRWRHPDATTAVSATVRHGCLFVYSTNTPFEPTGPDEPRGYTPFRVYATLEHGGDLKAAGRAARELKDGRKSTLKSQDPSSNGSRKLLLTPASDIELRRVRWCWEGRLALGTLGLLAGPEGLGKSTLACTIGAQVTRGSLPGEHHGTPRAVIVAATEDSWAHTIAPRFLAAGADLSHVFKIEAVDAGLKVPLSLPDDLSELSEVATELDAALMIFDPLISRLSKALDSHRDGEVRQALEPLVDIADRTGMALLGLIHHNKSGKADPLDLVMASKAFTAVARSVHTVIKDPDDEGAGARYFGTPKNNLGRLDLPSLSFTIGPFFYDTAEGPGTTGQIAWGPESDESISDLIRRAMQEPARQSKLGKAIEWLRDYLQANGPSAAKVVVKLGTEAVDCSTRTIHEAANRLGVVKSKHGFQGESEWSLPKDADGQTEMQGDSQDPASCKTARLGPTRGFNDATNSKDADGESPPARAREAPAVDPEVDRIDPELYGPDGSPWCRYGNGFACLNGSRCRNPRHAGPLEDRGPVS